MMSNGLKHNSQPTLQEWTSRKIVIFDEEEFYLFMLTHRNGWVFGYRVFDYATIRETAAKETIFEGQKRLYPPIPWMQTTR